MKYEMRLPQVILMRSTAAVITGTPLIRKLVVDKVHFDDNMRSMFFGHESRNMTFRAWIYF